jgi:DNA-nicking Smr family endonuclease
MKRARSFPVLEVSASPRHRSLSEDERTLWESVAKQVKPLRKKPRTAKPVQAAPERPAEIRPAAPPRPISTVQAAKPKSVPPLAPLGRRERSKLSRGRSEIDVRIDLHGMTQLRAHRALLSFLQRAHADGATFVLVITGKGKGGGSEEERGVLRRQVPNWLSLPEFRALVVGFEEAHIGHGGEGALYVRIRRARF